MTDQDTFRELIRRIRDGDERAATELVHRYEPLIRREVRMQLQDQRLGRILESMDVCQSVLASFFVRTAAGQYDLEQPGQLVRLLAAMARHKLASAARHQGRQRRDHRRLAAAGDAALAATADPGPSPSQYVAGRELLQRRDAALSAEERQLAGLRREGLAWAEIAARLGGKPQARRVQWARALDRVARQLGLEEASDG
jgi:RNA polymerase sigma-70 factor (ECF subfamily)